MSPVGEPDGEVVELFLPGRMRDQLSQVDTRVGRQTPEFILRPSVKGCRYTAEVEVDYGGRDARRRQQDRVEFPVDLFGDQQETYYRWSLYTTLAC